MKVAAMPHKMKVNTLGGCVLTRKVIPSNTIKELKTMLLNEKTCEDHKYLEVQVLTDNRLLSDDDQTLESLGLLHAESDVMVVYSEKSFVRLGRSLTL